jgi:putative phosphoribosyl transferase
MQIMFPILPPVFRGLSGAHAGTSGGMSAEPGTRGPASGGRLLPFKDRPAAGRLLAERIAAAVLLDHFPERAVVLGLPRGGVAVAKQVAVVLGLPLDVIVTRKIGYPPQPELGVGAIAEGLTQPVYDPVLLDRLSLSPEKMAPVAAAEEAELARRVRVYRGGNPLPPVAGWCVIVVDDGLATGVTARAALRSLRAARAAYLVLAVPVAPPAAAFSLRAEADQVIIVATPTRFSSVGQWYASFAQLTDADVLALLALTQVLRGFFGGYAGGIAPPRVVLSGVRAAHAAPALGRALFLVQAAPGAILLRPRDRIVKAVKPHRATSANALRLALPDLPLRLALAVRAEEEQQVFATARSSILPTPVRAGKHSRLPTYLRHGSITSTKMLQIVRYSGASGS